MRGVIEGPSYVYLLVSSISGNTYVGATVNLERRLRKHNGEIRGGARRTTSCVAKGETWTRAAYVSGFPDWTAALQFEWRWKQISRKLSGTATPLEKRMQALDQLLALERSTTKAVPYAEWPAPPQVHKELE
jgi:structure-specific endonuclease subunit SLX1